MRPFSTRAVGHNAHSLTADTGEVCVHSRSSCAYATHVRTQVAMHMYSLHNGSRTHARTSVSPLFLAGFTYQVCGCPCTKLRDACTLSHFLCAGFTFQFAIAFLCLFLGSQEYLHQYGLGHEIWAIILGTLVINVTEPFLPMAWSQLAASQGEFYIKVWAVKMLDCSLVPRLPSCQARVVGALASVRANTLSLDVGPEKTRYLLSRRSPQTSTVISRLRSAVSPNTLQCGLVLLGIDLAKIAKMGLKGMSA